MEQTKYKKEQNGYLSQELKKVLLEIRPKATETELEIIDVIAMTFILSNHSVSDYDIERVNTLLKTFKKECKNQRIESLKKELATLEGS